MALGKTAASWRSWISRDTTLVKVQAFTASSGVPCNGTRNMFPVMVRVTAEEEGSTKPPRRQHVGVDIVAVLDISGSMMGDKLERMKDAMANVIDKLGPDDRLSIVSFESNACRLTELTRMSDQGRVAARDKIKELFTKGGTSMGPALHEGAQILRGRRAEEMSSRVGCIVFLSDGLDSGIFQAPISSEFPAHTFGLGNDHDPKAMKHIADKTGGTYSFVNTDPSKIKYAFELFIAGITSVAATSVEITLGAAQEAGILIASIASGAYSNKTSSDQRSGTIRIDNMYAGEKKNFLVYLKLPTADKEGKQKVLTVGGQYQGLGASKQLASTDVSVMRPSKYTDRLKADPDVVAELARTELVKDMDLLCQKQTPDFNVELPSLLKNFKDKNTPTQAGRALSYAEQIAENTNKAYKEMMASLPNSEEGYNKVLKSFEEDYKKMEAGLRISINDHKKEGLPYMLSWLSSNMWQRATTMDEPSDNPFLTPVQVQVKDAAAGGGGAGGGAPPTASTPPPSTRWGKLVAKARSNLLPSVAVALSLASLLLAMLYSSALLDGSPKAAMNLGPMQYPMLTESNYAAWAIKMEAYMRAQGVWDAVGAEVSARKNQMALAAIYQAIPEGTLFLLSQKKTAKSAWEALKTMHIGDQRLRDAKLQTLRLEFEGLRMKETESVDEFAVRLTTIVNKIHTLGEHIEEPYVVKKFLRAVPNKYLQIASTIEQFGDLNTMTLQEVIGRLKVHEERLGRLGAAEKANELLTHSEWKAREEFEWKAMEEAENHDAYKVYASVAKILAKSRGGYGGDTYRVSASIAKILDILLTSVTRKEREELKSRVVQAHGDDEVTLRF